MGDYLIQGISSTTGSIQFVLQLPINPFHSTYFDQFGDGGKQIVSLGEVQRNGSVNERTAHVLGNLGQVMRDLCARQEMAQGV